MYLVTLSMAATAALHVGAKSHSVKGQNVWPIFEIAKKTVIELGKII